MRALLLLLAVLARAEGFTLNEQVLERYHFTLAQYQAMSPEDQERVFDWIRLQEQKRLIPPQRAAPKPHPAAKELSEATATPEAVFEGDGIKRLSLTTPGGAVVEGGTLGLDRRSALVAPSPYAGVGQDQEGSGRVMDYEVHSRLYALNLGARLYSDDEPLLDSRIDEGVSQLHTILPKAADSLRTDLAFSRGFERDWLVVGSAMGRVGRAYHVLPGIDAGWSAMGAMRVTGLFPNLTLDQTAGLRFGGHVGLFGGVTEAPGVFAKSVIQDSLAAEKFKTDVHLDAAPHVEVAAWGKLPYLSGVEYQITAGQQWNPWTTLRSVIASAGTDKASVFGRYSDESGPDIEFARQKAAVGASVSPSPGLALWAQYSRDSAKFGAAQMDSQGVLLGLTVRETAPARGSGAVTMQTLFGGKEQLVSPDEQALFVQLVQQLLDAVRALKNAASDWQAAQDAWNALPPDVKSLLPFQPTDLTTFGRLVDLLSDTKVLERLLVRYLRSQLLQKLDKVEIPVLGRDVRMSPAMVLAAAHSYALGLSPVPPMTAKDQDALDKLALDKAAVQAGCAPGPQPQAATDCILSKLPPAAAAKLEKEYGPLVGIMLKAAVDWPSGVLRREFDRMALQIVLAAETLDELSVDKGEKIADLNVRGLMSSFRALDRRDRPALKAAVQDLARNVDAENAALRERLAAYGAQRLEWLQSQPAWPANVRVSVRGEDWAQLLAVYGDAKLFDFILRLKAKTSGRILIELDRSPLQAIVVRKGPVETIGLPERGADLSLFSLEL